MYKIKLIRIYTITSELGNMVYIGSTEKTVDYRFKGHISEFKTCQKYVNNSSTTSALLFDEYGIKNCVITEIANQECNRQERDELENKYIDKYKANKLYNCVNLTRAGKCSIKDYPELTDILECACGVKHEKRFTKQHTQSNKHIQFVTNTPDSSRDIIECPCGHKHEKRYNKQHS